MRLSPLSLLLVATVAWAQEAPTPPPEAPPADGPNEPLVPEEVPVPAAEPAAPQPEPVAEDAPAADPELEALRRELDALRETVDAQREELARQRLLLIPKKDLEFDLGGYYRVRAHVYNHLFASQGAEGAYQDARFMTHRLRVQPSVRYRELASFHVQLEAFDDVLWGDNQSLASTALFAGDPSATDVDGQPLDSIVLSRAWMEVTVPVGVIRAGRMTSHWGMGLLANGGDGFDDTFGENKDGATFDRVLFATRPVAIAQAATGRNDTEVPLFAAVGVDRLVEDPLVQYYGFDCTAGEAVSEGDPCDTDGDGISDTTHGYTDDTRTPETRGQDWWADQGDDVMEMLYVLIYRGEDRQFLGAKGDLTAGAYVINRIQRETDSNVTIADAYLNVKNRGVRVEFEGVNIRGTTRAIALPGAVPGSGDDPLLKQASIWGYVGRLGYEQAGWAAFFETGYASGDDNVADATFTGRPLAADHNVGLLLYEEVLARVTAENWSEAAQGLWSQGGVYNSRYIFPNLRWYPMDNWEVIGAFLVAWPDKPDGAMIRCGAEANDPARCTAESSILGTEFDAAIKHRWHEHVLWSLEGGYAHATDRIALEPAGLNPNGNFFTVQSRLAFEF